MIPLASVRGDKTTRLDVAISESVASTYYLSLAQYRVATLTTQMDPLGSICHSRPTMISCSTAKLEYERVMSHLMVVHYATQSSHAFGVGATTNIRKHRRLIKQPCEKRVLPMSVLSRGSPLSTCAVRSKTRARFSCTKYLDATRHRVAAAQAEHVNLGLIPQNL